MAWFLPEELKQLADTGEAGLVNEVLAVFQTDTAERIESLRKALAAGDRTHVKNQAHAIKGSAAQVGANPLAAICHSLEAQAMTAEPAQLQSILRQLESAFSDVVRAMQSDPAK